MSNYSKLHRAVRYPVVAGLFIMLLPLVIIGAYGLYINFQNSWHYIYATFTKTELPSVVHDNFFSIIATVDLSTVTTLLIFYTAWCSLYGLFNILFSLKKSKAINNTSSVHRSSLSEKSFPFHKRYKIVYTEFGLLGTLFAFILAFQHAQLLSAKATNQADILLSALGTALWSSFSAIFLATVVCPMISIFYKWIAIGLFPNLKNGSTDKIDFEETIRVLKIFTGETQKAATALNKLYEKIGLERIDKFMTTVEKISQGIFSIDKKLSGDNGLESLAKKISSDTSEIANSSKGTHDILESTSKSISEIKSKIETLEQKSKDYEKKFKRVFS